jgi:hypothetical protein
VKINYLRISRIVWAASVSAALLFGNVASSSAQSSREWTDPVNISRAGSSTSPVTVVSSDGVIHAIWFDVFEETYRYSKSEDGGVTWSTPIKADFPFSKRGGLVKLAAGPGGIIHVFWINGLNLQYSRTTSSQLGSPSEWGSDKRLARFIVNFDVDVTPQGNLHVGYITSFEPEGVSYLYSTDGTFWLTPKFLFASSYLRSASLKDAHIRVVASDDPEDKRVYLVWDVRPQKRIYLASSPDSGASWTDAVQVKGPEDTGGFGIPFGAEIGIVGKSTLLVWQVGQPGGGQCLLYSQWLRDGSSEWESPEPVVGSQFVCPEQVSLSILEPGVPILILTYTGNSPTLLAWNGTAWSEPQQQEEISALSDPLTFETIMLGCFEDRIDGDRLILVGCDLGKGGDIWFTSRSLASWKDWFAPSTIWSPPAVIFSSSKQISSLTFASDNKYVHAVWAESPITDISATGSAILYARWDGRQWSTPQKVLPDLPGFPLQLSIAASNQGRLELSWVNEENGDLLYSWANSERANNAAEWSDPLVLPSPSQWNSAPDVFVDSAGRIGVVYALPVNENRGIYMVISEDKGLTWSSPLIVFDAESAGWQRVNDPKVTLSADGRLHLLFTRYAMVEEKPIELYYVQSVDSGVTWGEPQKVGDGAILWSDIVSYDGKFIQRLWQEENNSEIASLSQVSRDSGTTWENPINIAAVTDSSSPIGLIFDGVRELHFTQLKADRSLETIGRTTLTIYDSRWDGNKWVQQVFQEFTFSGKDTRFSMAGGLASNGFMNVGIVARYTNSENNFVSDILSINRSLGQSNENLTPFPAEIVLPEVEAVQTQTPIPALVPVQSTPLSGLAQSPSPLLRNVIGLVIVLAALGVMVFVFVKQAFRKR